MKKNNINTIKHFAQKLKKLREQHGYSMDSFCEAFNKKYNANLNKSTVSRYESTSQEPMLTTAKNIADFFNVTASELLGYPKIVKTYEICEEDYFILKKIKDLTPKEKKILALLFEDK